MRFFLGFFLFTAVWMGNAQQKTLSDTLALREPVTIDLLMQKKRNFNQNENLLNRYTVQLYSGSYEEAQKNLEKFTGLFVDYKAIIKFQTPNYKVWITNFPNKLEAEKLFFAARPEFPSILMFRTK